MTVTAYDILTAADRIRPHVLRTPLLDGAALGFGDDLRIKPELLQPTGSFKLRGAMNAVLSLTAEDRAAGVVTASSGNHGPALAYAARRSGADCTVCLCDMVPENKVANVRAQGGLARIEGADFDASVAVARRLEAEEGRRLIHAFDDPAVVAGAGTAGLEIAQDLRAPATVLVPLSGGGLLAGVALALKSFAPDLRVVGVSATGCPSMHESLRQGKPVDVPDVDSLADALGGNIGTANRWTYPLVRDNVDETVVVSEEAIAEAMRLLYRRQGLVVEGAGAVPLAALIEGKVDLRGGPGVLLLTGRNVGAETFDAVISGG